MQVIMRHYAPEQNRMDAKVSFPYIKTQGKAPLPKARFTNASHRCTMSGVYCVVKKTRCQSSDYKMLDETWPGLDET